jgi:UrcA family protein
MSSNTKTLSRVPFVFVTGALLAFAAVTSAHANEEPVRSETVKFEDLNVGTPSGVQALYERIHRAARRVCSEPDALQQLAAKTCAQKAEARAIASVSLPQLTAYYQMKTGDRSQPLIANR